jgi:hypothetical protein
MSQIIEESPQSFVYTKLNERQKLEGTTLTQDQKLVIQNERATIAEQLLGLEFDATNTLKFVQEQAFLQGQLATFKWLLDASNAAEAVLIDLARTQDSQDSDQQA